LCILKVFHHVVEEGIGKPLKEIIRQVFKPINEEIIRRNLLKNWLGSARKWEG
jgi:hypothetical protein